MRRIYLIGSGAQRTFASAKTRAKEKIIKSDFHSWESHCIHLWHGYAAHFTAHFKDEGSLLLLANFKGPVPFRAHSWLAHWGKLIPNPPFRKREGRLSRFTSSLKPWMFSREMAGNQEELLVDAMLCFCPLFNVNKSTWCLFISNQT